MTKKKKFTLMGLNPQEKAKQAFDKGNYFEAIAILHAAVEYLLKNYYYYSVYLNQFKKIGEDEKKTAKKLLKEVYRKPISQVLLHCYLCHLLNLTEYKELDKFNQKRNSIIHRAFTSDLSKRDVNEAYKLGMKYVKAFKTRLSKEMI